MNLDTETASELAIGYSFEGYHYVARQLESKHRWYERYLIVFDLEGTLWGFLYDEPATEEQEGMERFDSDPVKCFRVTGTPVSKMVYEKTDE